MLTPKNLKVIQFTLGTANSAGEIVRGTEHIIHLMFNCTRITEEQVVELVDSDRWQFSDMVVQVTPEQVKNLHDREEA